MARDLSLFLCNYTQRIPQRLSLFIISQLQHHITSAFFITLCNNKGSRHRQTNFVQTPGVSYVISPHKHTLFLVALYLRNLNDYSLIHSLTPKPHHYMYLASPNPEGETTLCLLCIQEINHHRNCLFGFVVSLWFWAKFEWIFFGTSTHICVSDVQLTQWLVLVYSLQIREGGLFYVE